MLEQEMIEDGDDGEKAKSTMQREKPETSQERKAYIQKWLDNIKKAKEHWKKIAFDQMKKDMTFAAGEQWAGDTGDSKYKANLVQRHIQQRVSSLYAKNPKVVAKKRQTLDYVLWDGNIESLKEAMMAIQQAASMQQMPPPEAVALMEEISAVRKKKAFYEKVGKTAEILFAYYMEAQSPNFKIQAKQLIRRVETCGVGYVKLGFNRAMDKSPELMKTIADMTSRLAVIKQKSSDIVDGEIPEDAAEHEELEQALATLQNTKDVIVNEGLVFDFPKSYSIIPSKSTTCIKGWINTQWIAQEFYFTADEIKQIYDVDVKGHATSYSYGADGQAAQQTNSSSSTSSGSDDDVFIVYEVQDKSTGMVFTVCEGYPDYLSEPEPPKLILPRFFNIYSLSFNDLEDDKKIFPPSDVYLLRPMQLEYNRTREGLREHRKANRPLYLTTKGLLEDEDKTKLMSHEAHDVVELNVNKETPIDSVIQPAKKVPIDPSLYDASPLFDDIMKVVGVQEANLGGTGSASATEVSVAEGTRLATVSSNVDDLDDLLSELAEDGSRIMFQHVSLETAKKIAGAGAEWVDGMSAQEIADMLYLEVKAGSSGRPNKAQEIANFERLAPTLLQLGGISPTWLAKQALIRLDDSMDLDEAIIEGMPSMIMQNSMQQPSTGNPATDPAQQGMNGGNKAGTPNINAGGQASHPAASDVLVGNAGG